MEAEEQTDTEQTTDTSTSNKKSSSEAPQEKPKIDIETKEKSKKETKKPHTRHNPKKEKEVKNLAEKIKNAKTLMLVSIKGLPSKQFQDIKKTLRKDASVQVAKKNIILRAIKAVGKDSILDLQKQVQENSAFVISDMEGYELAGILATKKNPVYAKAGQEASEDIEVKPGPTNLVPGPAISELGALGLQVAVEDGKISIKNKKVIVNKGQKINTNAASILQKLDIQPFSVGLEPIAIYDVENEKIYTDIKINAEETAENLKAAASKALGFAQKIVYYCKETIGYLLAKANAENQALDKLAPAESTDTSISDKKSNSEEQKQEEKPTEQGEKSDTENKKEEKVEEEKPAEEKVEKIKKDETQTKSEEEK
jgi:ribosomal protein L10